MTTIFNELIGKEVEKLISELCPNCGAEASFYWDLKDSGYQAYCPHCGNILMLCSECDVRNYCDWSECGIFELEYSCRRV